MRGQLCDFGNRWFARKHSGQRSIKRGAISGRAIFGRRLRCECLEQRALLDAGGLSAEASPFDTVAQDMFVDAGDLMPPPAYASGEILIKMAEWNLGALSRSLHIATHSSVAAMGPELPTASFSGLLSMYSIGGPVAVFPRAPQAALFQIDTQSFRMSLDGSGDSVADDSESDSNVADRSDLDRWYRVALPADADVEAMVAAFEAVAEVEYAEPNYEWGLTDEIPPVIEGLPDGTTDPAYDTQWFHTNAKIPNAWNYLNTNGVYPGGNRDVVVAVIDTGVDYTHEELAANMWVNADEIPGNDIDDDGNGFVDDVHGCSVVSDGRSHAGDPVDFHGHGTHVAGIIAAQGFNGEGGVGVAFNTQIMAVRAAQYSGTLTTQDISEGILYAVENGAEVINMSFGGYQRSQIVVDALEVALNQAVLVAAAGNDGLDSRSYPLYPAALPWVVGVMASTPDNLRAWFSNYGPHYEISAPGVSIHSTLPEDGYASWSGTSMATPVVSGVAALMRSYFWQRDIYSSRFIMGSIAASGSEKGNVVDAYKALTEPPKPGVSLYENWLFDDQGIDAVNDDDGRIDSGETIHLAVELINRSGSAENVTATLKAQAQGAVMPDPYVTITTDTVGYGGIGPFALADNGLLWDTEGVITGVQNPFVFEVSPDCPNDHVIPFVLTTTFEDGWDEESTTYERVSRFEYVVQRGKNIPTVISEDMELTSEEYWMVAGPVLIEEQATLTIAEGTQVQWGAISDDPYNPGPQSGYIVVRGKLQIEGTQECPVNMFPSYLVSGQTVDIRVEGGQADVSFATILNPKLVDFRSIDHVYFDWDAYASTIDAEAISNTVFHKLRGGGSLEASLFESCLFDAGWLEVPYHFSETGQNFRPVVRNTAFLQDNENNTPLSLRVSNPTWNTDYLGGVWGEFINRINWMGISSALVANGRTYAILPVEFASLPQAELIASFYGGHVACIENAEEQALLKSYVSSSPRIGGLDDYFHIGLCEEGELNTYYWIDGLRWTPIFGQPRGLFKV